VVYGIVSHVIEQISDQRFNEFVKDHILRPLRMTRTIMTRAEVHADANFATPCLTLGNGQSVKLDFEDWPCEHVSPLLTCFTSEPAAPKHIVRERERVALYTVYQLPRGSSGVADGRCCSPLR
jgi:hypothetical protein